MILTPNILARRFRLLGFEELHISFWFCADVFFIFVNHTGDFQSNMSKYSQHSTPAATAVCFGPFRLHLPLSFFRTSPLLRKVWTTQQVKRKMQLTVRIPSSGVILQWRAAEIYSTWSPRLPLLPRLTACLWREGQNDGWEERHRKETRVLAGLQVYEYRCQRPPAL